MSLCSSNQFTDLDGAIRKIQQKKKKLKSKSLTALHVCVPDCVLVTNLKPDTSQDNIDLYFESQRRSGGGTVRDVQLNSEDNQAIVFFEDYRGKKIKSQEHYRLLGHVRDDPNIYHYAVPSPCYPVKHL